MSHVLIPCPTSSPRVPCPRPTSHVLTPCPMFSSRVPRPHLVSHFLIPCPTSSPHVPRPLPMTCVLTPCPTSSPRVWCSHPTSHVPAPCPTSPLHVPRPHSMSIIPTPCPTSPPHVSIPTPSCSSVSLHGGAQGRWGWDKVLEKLGHAQTGLADLRGRCWTPRDATCPVDQRLCWEVGVGTHPFAPGTCSSGFIPPTCDQRSSSDVLRPVPSSQAGGGGKNKPRCPPTPPPCSKVWRYGGSSLG